MLNGKCKKDFEKWYSFDEFNHPVQCVINENDYGETFVFEVFLTLPLEMKYGVYVDFFDSVGIVIEINICIHGFDFIIQHNKNILSFKCYYKTRHEARTEAIKQANKIYNGNTF